MWGRSVAARLVRGWQIGCFELPRPLVVYEQIVINIMPIDTLYNISMRRSRFELYAEMVQIWLVGPSATSGRLSLSDSQCAQRHAAHNLNRTCDCR